MHAPRRTKAELESDNAGLTTEVTALRNFVFVLDLSRENAGLEAQRPAETAAGFLGGRAGAGSIVSDDLAHRLELMQPEDSTHGA
jgi:hypothetical protein